MRLIRAVPMLLLLLLCACGTDQTSAQTPVHFRTALTENGGCTYDMQLRADYGDYIRDFTLSCTYDGSGASLTVTIFGILRCAVPMTAAAHRLL